MNLFIISYISIISSNRFQIDSKIWAVKFKEKVQLYKRKRLSSFPDHRSFRNRHARSKISVKCSDFDEGTQRKHLPSEEP